jgi:hypothetical protein
VRADFVPVERVLLGAFRGAGGDACLAQPAVRFGVCVQLLQRVGVGDLLGLQQRVAEFVRLVGEALQAGVQFGAALAGAARLVEVPLGVLGGRFGGVYRDGDFGRVGLRVVWGVQGGRACGQVVPKREDEFAVELPAVGVLAGVQGALQVGEGAFARLQRTAQAWQQALAQRVRAGVLDALAERLLPTRG